MSRKWNLRTIIILDEEGKYSKTYIMDNRGNLSPRIPKQSRRTREELMEGITPKEPEANYIISDEPSEEKEEKKEIVFPSIKES